MAENLKGSTVKTAGDYLQHVMALMRQSKISFTISSDITTEMIGNRPFERMETSSKYGGNVDVMQSYYVFVDKGFALALLISYSNNEQRDQLEKNIHMLKFK